MAQNNILYRVGYNSSFNTKTGKYQYSFWDLGHCVTLESAHRFLEGDVVSVLSVDAERHVVNLLPEFTDRESGQVLMFVAPKVPLDDNSTFHHRTNDCALIHNRVISSKGNMTIISLLAVPLVGKSSLTFIEEKSKDRFHYFIQGA